MPCPYGDWVRFAYLGVRAEIACLESPSAMVIEQVSRLWAATAGIGFVSLK